MRNELVWRTEPSLILLGPEVVSSLGGRLHWVAASRRSTMGTSMHIPLIPQNLQLPSSARPNDQWQTRLPGQWRHPAALNTFIFPPGRFRPPDRSRQQRQQWRQNEKERDNGKEETVGERERRDKRCGEREVKIEEGVIKRKECQR